MSTVASGVEDLLAFDREHLWHPYSSMTSPAPAYLVESAAGVRLSLRRTPDTPPVEVIDAMSSWWCAIHGYAVPELDAAVRAQLSDMSHVMFGGLTHAPAIGLGRRLTALTGFDKVFLADSGSVSVEVALKMALQFHARPGRSLKRTKFLALRGGYHGDTFGAMSVCDPEGGMHSMYAEALPQHVFAPRPPGGFDTDLGEWASEVRALFNEHGSELAAVILEPRLQGAGGMHMYPGAAVQLLASLAREHGALVIFDEIATGFWRTGTAFAAEQCDVKPDIMCVGKALTGGYLSLAAVLTTSDVASSVDASPAGAMMHGPTFMANPLACAVANASLDVLASSDTAQRVEDIEDLLDNGLHLAAELPGVVDVRTLGAVGVIELDSPVDVSVATAAALDAGVWIRPFRNLIYTMPPYISSPDEIETICDALLAATAAVTRGYGRLTRPLPRHSAWEPTTARGKYAGEDLP